MSKPKPFTLRLSDDDQQRLHELAEHYAADRSETLRKALRQAHRQQAPFPTSGSFAASNGVRFKLQLKGSNHD